LVDRFRQGQRSGLKQADLAKRLGVSRPQIHIWLTDPDKMTLKAAARLMLAMGSEDDLAAIEVAITAARPRD
jgi:plasmid maintenance system antidote protein VapI